MLFFLETVISGLMAGVMYSLVALGFVLIFKASGIFNFAQGEFVLLGAYVTYLAYAHGAPVWAGMVAAPFVVGAIGFVLEALIIRRFYAAPIVAMSARLMAGNHAVHGKSSGGSKPEDNAKGTAMATRTTARARSRCPRVRSRRRSWR